MSKDYKLGYADCLGLTLERLENVVRNSNSSNMEYNVILFMHELKLETTELNGDDI